MIGRTLAQYRIEAKIGKGGMGVVYRAEDTRLHRTVALKFLPPDSLDRATKIRFVQEARTAARLSHPNICPIYELCEVGDEVFFAMALLDGQTLSERIGGAPMEVADAVALAIQIAGGLEEAHRQNVIHRDIKSNNIIVSAGNHAYILDFGLALLNGSTRMTVPGIVAGTAAYMSPEQATGEEVDHRSDLWALGIVLYEMLAGHRPFDRDRDITTLYAIVHEPAPALPQVPAALGQVVEKALAKDPAQRYQSAREFAADLRAVLESRPMEAPTVTHVQPVAVRSKRRTVLAVCAAAIAVLAGVGVWQRTAGPAGEKHIAILPFEVIGGDVELRAISDGLVDTLTSRLSQSENGQKNLLVVPASEIRSRKITSAEEAHRIYGATLVVSGSAQGSGGSALFNVNLIDAVHMRQLGSRSFEFDPKNPIGIRKEALTRLLSLLHVELANAANPPEGETATPAAYTEYLKARGYMARYDVAGNLDRAVESFQTATRLDPKYALAFSGLAEAMWRKAADTSDKALAGRALEAALQAVQLDPKLASAHARLGELYVQNGRRDEAVTELQAALRLEPSNADAHRGLAGLYESMGRFPEAEQAYLNVTRFRPTDWLGFLNLGVFYWDRNRYNEAESAFQTAAALTPSNDIVHRNAAGLFVTQGKYQQARDAALKALQLKPSARTHSLIGLTYYYQRRFPEAAAALEASVELDGSYSIGWGNLGSVYRWIPGQEAKAKAALTRAVELAEKRLEVTPKEYGIRANLAEYRAKLGDTKQALEEIERIPEPNRGAYWARLAIAYSLSGQRPKATAIITSALQNAALPHELRDDPDLAQCCNQLPAPLSKSTP